MSRETKPIFSKSRVNKAGKNVRDGIETHNDIEVIENWRASHNHVLNTWQANLRRRVKHTNITFAQRLKRRITIFDKLQREHSMSLSSMHDIAGCRLIFENLDQLVAFRKTLHTKSRIEHILYKKDEDPYNYIEYPKDTGYRGIHDVYVYKSQHHGGEHWNDLKVEIQYRTRAQHAWATAVEIAGSMTGNHSKFNRGSELHKDFFRLASEIISRVHEDMKSCFPNLNDKEVVIKFNEIEENIHLLRSLKTLRVISTEIPIDKKNIILRSTLQEKDKNNRENYVTKIYTYDSLPLATEAYFKLEKEVKDNEDLVLVRASEGDLKSAYRNYFSDTIDFVELIESGISSLKS